MNAFIASVEPAHATPTNVTRPSYSFRASSTEGASALHEPQPGAQNHRTVGPVMSGNTSTSKDRLGTGDSWVAAPDVTDDAWVTSGAGAATTSLVEESAPHPTAVITRAETITISRMPRP